MQGASVFTISMGPEYPGLDDSVLKNGMKSHWSPMEG
jgi:hypothetical protein